MTSSKPYLIRAIYDWLIDNDLTPYIVVDASDESLVQVPREHVENDRIILNISPRACRGLHLENDRIVFSARFSGEIKQLFIPPTVVQAIYAKENGRGMVFGDDDETEDGGPTHPSPTTPPTSKSRSPVGKPKLKVIK